MRSSWFIISINQGWQKRGSDHRVGRAEQNLSAVDWQLGKGKVEVNLGLG